MTNKKKFKKVKTSLGINVNSALPMLEEITALGLFPVCVIGAKGNLETKKVDLCFATISDEHDKIVYNFCKNHVEQNAHLYENKQ